MPNGTINTATFRGKRYRIIWRIPKRHKEEGKQDSLGVCESRDSKSPCLCIQNGQNELENLATHIHEALHASLWDLDEAAIQETADDLARFLWRCGYRPM